MQLLIGLGILALLVFGLQAFSRANPAQVAKLVRRAGGLALCGLALLLLTRGQIHLAVIVMAVALPFLLGRGGGLFGSWKRSPGQTSKVETAYLRLQLDHDTGLMEGEVLAGKFAGRRLADIGLTGLQTLLLECRDHDPRSLALVEAYLDHHYPEWREAAGKGGARGSSVSTTMTVVEARQILGVGPGAGDEEIRSAWRELMKRNHPDQGGSSYLATKINEAKDVLLDKTGNAGRSEP